MSLPRSLLLVVDVQRGFMNEHTEPVVAKINELVETWQARDWPIIYSRFINLPGSNWQRLRDWHELEQEPDTLLAEELKVVPPYIFKKSTSAAWSHEVIAVCMAHGVKDVVLAGIDTNECVLSTALAIFDDNFAPWVVEDACASSGGQELHAAAIKLLKPLLGEQQIITATQALKQV